MFWPQSCPYLISKLTPVPILKPSKKLIGGSELTRYLGEEVEGNIPRDTILSNDEKREPPKAWLEIPTSFLKTISQVKLPASSRSQH